MVCKNCGSSEVVTDTSTNEKVCQGCSQVLENNSIVSEVTFAENAAGAATVTGTYVSLDQSHASGAGGKFGMGNTSRHQTIEKNRARIQKVALRLGINESAANQATQYFKLALQLNFVKGRKSQYVVAACLYAACRKLEMSHMLMDFAEVIVVNVFQIGATYLQLVRCLNLEKIPCIDPSIFIERFVSQLSFGPEGSKKVSDDANKLAQRMNRDWLVYGRRPAGIAAACILLAARMNNFRRSKSEIVQVAKIAEETVQRRLDEFKETSAGTLTVSDFRNTEIETQADPPAFTRHRIAEARLEEQRQKTEERKALGGHVIADDENDIMITEMIRDIDRQEQQHEGEEEEGGEEDEKDEKAKLDEKRISDEIDLTLHDPSFKETSKGWQIIKKYQEIKKEEEMGLRQPDKWVDNIRDDPESLSDVDDDEIESLILNKREVEIKSQVWMSMNRDYLIEMENKRLKEDAEMKAGTYKAPRKRKRKAKEEVKDEEQESAPLSAADSARKMLAKASFSRKINYAAVDSLFKKKA